MTRFLTASLLALMPALPVAAQTAPDPADLIHAELLEGWRQPDGTHVAGLQILLAPGWKTYWRAPGDGGIPPLFSWAGSDNLSAQATLWPTPEVSTKNGIRTIGYRDEVVWPMLFTPRDAGEEIHITARINLGVCEDVCIPVTLDITGALPATGGMRDPRITDALARQPLPAKKGGVRDVSCAVAPTEDGLQITARITLPDTGKGEVAVFEHPDRALWVSEAEVSRDGRDLIAVSEFVSVTGEPFPLNRSDIRITVLGSDRAVDIQGCPAG